MTRVVATRTPGEREDAEAERLVRPAPKQKPPRHDRRREDMQMDAEGDADLKGKDTSLNYKAIGGSLVERVLHRYAGRGDRIPARSRETDKVVFISEKALKEHPEKYEKWKPKDRGPKAGPAQSNGERAKPPRPRPKPPRPRPKPGSPEGAGADSKGPSEPEKPPVGGETPDGGTPAALPEKPEKPKRKKREKAKAKGDGSTTPTKEEEAPKGEAPTKGDEPPKGEAPTKEEGAPTKGEGKGAKPVSIAEKHGIQPPKRREATAAEHAEASLLLADHLPSDLAAKLIASNVHPDDARELVGAYRAAKSRPTGNLEEFASKAAEFHETDPERVEPPKSWKNTAGVKVAFEKLTSEEKNSAYRQHQMQVVAMSLAAQHQLEEKLGFEGLVPKSVAKALTHSLLKKVEAGSVDKVAAKIFEETAESKGFIKIPDGSIKWMLRNVKGSDAAKSMLRSYLEANDYKRAKDIYLKGQVSERDKPAKILDSLRSARDFFEVQARGYGDDDKGHEGAKRFQTKTLTQLKGLSPEKYKVVRRALDEEDATAYRKAKKQHAREQGFYEWAHAAWEKKPFEGQEPKAPKPPIEPIGYSNSKKSGELADEGRQLWEDMQERATAKTASRVASKFLISSYLRGSPMPRTPNPLAKRSLYHGTDPGSHYPREPYPKWAPVPARDLSEGDHEVILSAAREWLGDEVPPREALDLALADGTYKPDVQTYDLLLTRLQGARKQAGLDRGRLERAIYGKFPPDSKRKQAGKPVVMLTGDVAAKLARPDFALVALKDLSAPELEKLAKTMRVDTSLFDAGHRTTARGSAPDTRKPDTGVRQMLRLSSDQKAEANQILASFDQLANSIQHNYQKWGMSPEAAKEVVNRLDRTADEAEALFFGGDSLRNRQAEIAVGSDEFRQDALDSGLLTRSQLSKAARVIQRDPDEGYMETFKNPMSPIETDSDEPYMSAYGDDQSSSVSDGSDNTGRELAPGA